MSFQTSFWKENILFLLYSGPKYPTLIADELNQHLDLQTKYDNTVSNEDAYIQLKSKVSIYLGRLLDEGLVTTVDEPEQKEHLESIYVLKESAKRKWYRLTDKGTNFIKGWLLIKLRLTDGKLLDLAKEL